MAHDGAPEFKGRQCDTLQHLLDLDLPLGSVRAL